MSPLALGAAAFGLLSGTAAQAQDRDAVTWPVACLRWDRIERVPPAPIPALVDAAINDYQPSRLDGVMYAYRNRSTGDLVYLFGMPGVHDQYAAYFFDGDGNITARLRWSGFASIIGKQDDCAEMVRPDSITPAGWE